MFFIKENSSPIKVFRILFDDDIVACFPNARTVEERSLETGAQQKKNECL
jgi:hypothetical protein